MTELKVRDHLANERTFLAWVRTSIALMGFGVVVAKLSFLLIPQMTAIGATSSHPGARSLRLGIAFVAVGLLTLIFATINYGQTRRMIENDNYRPLGVILLVFVMILVGLGIACLAYLLKL